MECAVSRANAKMEQFAYRVYVTDMLAGLFSSITGHNPEARYYDVVRPDRTPQVTAIDAKTGILNKLRKEVEN